MKSIVLRFLGWMALVILSIVSLSDLVVAESCVQWVAKATSVQGKVESLRVGETQWRSVKMDDTYCPGDQIRVLENSRADLVLANQAVMRINENSAITLEALKEQKTSLIDLVKGAAHFFSRQPSSLEVKTPYTIAGVRGTEFVINVGDKQTALSVFEGSVLAQNNAGSVELRGGQSAVAEAGRAPVLRVVARPRDAVSWALYYPPVIYVPGKHLQATEAQRYAFSFAQKAADLLAVGQVEKAEAEIQNALRLQPNFSEAFALQTIIAIVQNDKKKALELAQKATQANPKSASGWIALSYAQQANFDLEGARKSLEEAVKVEPNNALAWARLSEVWSMFGNLGKSQKAAERAVAIDPNLALTQTVLGFAYLTQIKTRQARQAFGKAIELDQAAPLPRLGLGLAQIRDGSLQQGGKEIEIAASLDPNNSLIRSYLGKTYYEEKRTPLAEREYSTAKELDPQDPTPWFYDAIAKQTTNRPVEALQNYQKSIELNDNLAVYRSRLLLDSDLAARSATIARVYNDLGFQERALVEGWKSVNIDPTNWSAHRFLADSYSVLPRHEIARVSELLQSQLLQPINITPLQPRLAESNLFLISSQGPANASFNSYNPLFARNQVVLTADGIVGENSTYAGEGIVSGIYNKFSFSGGYSNFQTDGWRENAGENDSIGSAFVQWAIDYKTNIQAEFRHRDLGRGDTQLRFFEDDYLPNLSQDEDTNSYRVGMRHSFSPGSILLANFAYQKTNFTLTDENVNDWLFDFPTLDAYKIGGPQEAYSAELQHLFRSRYVNLTSGFGYFNVNTRYSIDQSFFSASDPMEMISSGTGELKDDTNHYNLYLYSYLNLLKDVTVTLGMSADFFKIDDDGNDDLDMTKNQFNPKFGVMWNPLAGTLLRGAVFRTLKRTLITDQTLEPTQVAGFNQFFDEADATEAWVYGAAIDQKFTDSLFGGVEFTRRDLSVPWYESAGPPDYGLQLKDADWQEDVVRTYLYWTPYKWFSLGVGYSYEKFDRAEELPAQGIKNVETNKVPLSVNFFHPSGISAGVRTTYYHQHGVFYNELDPPGVFSSGSSDFWVVDAMLSYRLPKRFGFISVGATNLFNQHFEYAETDINNATIQPTRTVFGKITLQF